MLLSKQKLFALGVALLLPLSVQADSLLPDIPKAKRKYSEATLCVEPKDEMRKNHMNYIMHQRDDTLRKGVRTTQYSLKECIGCHNAPADDGKVASVETNQHFCSSCHSYSAVNVDCFDCHNDKPENAEYRHSSAVNSALKHAKHEEHNVNNATLDRLVARGESEQ